MNSKAMMFGVILAVVLSAFVVVADAQETDAAVGCDISYIGDSESAVAVVELDSFQPIGNGGLFLVLTGVDSVQMSQGAFMPPMTFTFERSPDLITMSGHYTAELVLNDRGVEQTIATGTLDVVEITFTDGSSEVPMFIGGTVDVPNAEDLGLTGQGEFRGWATSEGGDVRFAEGGTMSVDDLGGVTTLYAVYGTGPVVEEVTVTFDSNGGEGEMPEQVIAVNTLTALDKNAFTRDGYTFAGWNTAADGSGTSYGDGAEVNLTTDLTLYAQWTPITVTEYTVHIDSVEHVTITVKAGDTVINDGDRVADRTELTITYYVETGYRIMSSSGNTVTVNGGDVRITATVERIPEEPPVLDSITVSGEFDKVYQVGDTLDLDGMVVTAHYTNGGDDKVLSEGDYTVTPANGSRLNSVIDHVTVSYTEGGVTRTVEVPITVTELPVYTVSKDCENGTVSGPSEIVEGGSGSYTVSPDYGYRIYAVSYTVGGGQPESVTVDNVMRCSFEIQNVIGPVTITATFESDATGTVTVTAGDHGSIGAGGATSAPVTVYGHWSATVTVEPDNGYRVSGISHDGAENSVTYEDGVLIIAAGSDVTKIDIAFEQIPVSDDDEEYVPPVITVIPGDDDDSTTYIVAIAAGVVVAILAALILMQTRKN